MATKKTLLNIMEENSSLAIECKTKEELTKSLYRLFRVGKILFEWDNVFLDNTVKEISNIQEYKRAFLVMRRIRGKTILEIYCDNEEDKKDEEGKIIGYSNVTTILATRLGIGKIHDTKYIEKLIDGIREEENSHITFTHSIEKFPAQRIPDLNQLMENVDEGRMNGRRREAAHAQRERDRAAQRRRDGELTCELRQSPRRPPEPEESPIPSVAIVNQEEISRIQHRRASDPYEMIMHARYGVYPGSGAGS